MFSALFFFLAFCFFLLSLVGQTRPPHHDSDEVFGMPRLQEQNFIKSVARQQRGLIQFERKWYSVYTSELLDYHRSLEKIQSLER